MSTIETFDILFRSNAKQAQDDVKKLDAQIAELAEKGNKRSEEETKQLKELRRLRQEHKQDLRDQTNQVDSLTSALLNMGLTAVTAFAGFEAVKKATSSAYDLNLNLQKTAILTGENATKIQAWDQAFATLGVNQGEFTGWFTQLSQVFQATGRDTKQIIPDLIALSNVLRTLEAQGRDSEARAAFQNAARAYGLPQDFFVALLKGGSALDELAGKQEKLLHNTEEGEAASRRFGAAWQNAGTALRSGFTDVLDHVLIGLFHVVDLVEALAAGNFKKAFDLWRGIGQQSSSATSPSSSGVGTTLGLRNNNPGNLQPGGREASFPTLSAGISAEKAQLQSYGARGINTISKIASTWPDRAHAGSWLASLQKTTGYDVNQKLDMNDPATLSKLAAGINVAEGDAAANIAIAGQTAITNADSSGLNSASSGNGGNSLSIGSMVVHTQAKDAPGIADAIAAELNRAYRATVSNWDDGVAK